MTPSTTAMSAPALPWRNERRDQLGAAEEGVEVAPRAARGERVVARVDVVGADLEALHGAGRARRSAADAARVATVVLPAPELVPRDDDARDHAAASTRARRAAARPPAHGARRAARLGQAARGRPARCRAPQRSAGTAAASCAPSRGSHAVVGADGERAAGPRDGVAQRREQLRRRAPRARATLAARVAAVRRLVGRADVDDDALARRASIASTRRARPWRAGRCRRRRSRRAGRRRAAPSSRAQPAAAPRAATTTVVVVERAGERGAVGPDAHARAARAAAGSGGGADDAAAR